jgi:hypothetical protein
VMRKQRASASSPARPARSVTFVMPARGVGLR